MDGEPSPVVDASAAPSDDLRRAQRTAAIEATLTSAAIAGLAGAVAGLVWGGIGGRVAMRVIFLTSNDRVRGVTSDDGFEIGTISASTIFLLIFTTILGAMAGMVFGLLRMLLRGPRGLVAIGVGVTAAVGAGGGMIVHADGIDFRLLGPLWLAVSMFLLIPALWGVTVVFLTEYLLHQNAVFPTLPSQIDTRYGGAVGNACGWLILALVTAVGLVDLADDLAELT